MSRKKKKKKDGDHRAVNSKPEPMCERRTLRNCTHQLTKPALLPSNVGNTDVKLKSTSFSKHMDLDKQRVHALMCVELTLPCIVLLN